VLEAIVRDVYEVLREKEETIEQVRREVEGAEIQAQSGRARRISRQLRQFATSLL
jgi:hypothetical protein